MYSNPNEMLCPVCGRKWESNTDITRCGALDKYCPNCGAKGIPSRSNPRGRIKIKRKYKK